MDERTDGFCNYRPHLSGLDRGKLSDDPSRTLAIRHGHSMTYGSVRKFGSDREKKLWYENCLPSFLAHSGWFLADAVRRCWPPHFLSWASDLSGCRWRSASPS